jgi:Mrp family chromosome partitioning ATPase/uncharacterized protein involved in exopolysaccharide biosynthesis
MKTRHTPNEVMDKLREGKRLLDNGEDLKDVMRQLKITPSTWNRWNKDYGDDGDSADDFQNPGAEVLVTIERTQQPEDREQGSDYGSSSDGAPPPVNKEAGLEDANNLVLPIDKQPDRDELEDLEDPLAPAAEDEAELLAEQAVTVIPQESDQQDEQVDDDDNPVEGEDAVEEQAALTADDNDFPDESVVAGDPYELGVEEQYDDAQETEEAMRKPEAIELDQPQPKEPAAEETFVQPSNWRGSSAAERAYSQPEPGETVLVGTDSARRNDRDDAVRTNNWGRAPVTDPEEIESGIGTGDTRLVGAFEAPQFNPLTPIRQQPLIVILAILIFAGLGYLYGSRMTPQFSASAGLVVEDTRRSLFVTPRANDAERYVADQIAVLTSRTVAEQASSMAATMEPGASIPVADLLANVEVSSDLRTDFLTITFVASDPTTAQVGANAIGRAYEQVVAARVAEDAANAVSKLNAAIDETVAGIVSLQTELESRQSGGVDRQLLENQLAAIAAELANIRSQGLTTEEIKAKADQLAAELQARRLLTEVEDSDPEVTLLLRRLEDGLTLLSDLTLQRSQLEVDSQLAGNGVALFSAAGRGSRTGGSLVSVLAVSIVMGAIAGSGGAYLLNERKIRVSSRLDPQRLLGLPLLGEIPAIRSTVLDPELAVEGLPGSSEAQAFHGVVEEIQRQLKDEKNLVREPGAGSDGPGGTIIAVASPGFMEGKTTVAVNVALAASRAGLRTLLVDADLSQQRATSVLLPFSSRGRDGLGELLGHKAELKDVLIPISLAGRHTIDLLHRGESSPAWTDLRSSVAARAFEALRGLYDVIIVDTAPVLHVPPARSAFRPADYALVVIKHQDLVENAEELLIRLNLLGVPSLGYVYTRVPRISPDAVGG